MSLLTCSRAGTLSRSCQWVFPPQSWPSSHSTSVSVFTSFVMSSRNLVCVPTKSPQPTTLFTSFFSSFPLVYLISQTLSVLILAGEIGAIITGCKFHHPSHNTSHPFTFLHVFPLHNSQNALQWIVQPHLHSSLSCPQRRHPWSCKDSQIQDKLG